MEQIIFVLLLIIIIYSIYDNIINNDMVYVKSDIDNKVYIVNNYKDKKHAANMLATLRQNIFIIADHTRNKIHNIDTLNMPRYVEFKPYIVQLNNKIQNIVIKEAQYGSNYTSYTVNKGEQMVLCIRHKNINKKIHNLNILMYVLLHEMSHIACPEYNHTPLFKKIFRFMCEEAIEIGLYTRINYTKYPELYCGMNINETII